MTEIKIGVTANDEIYKVVVRPALMAENPLSSLSSWKYYGNLAFHHRGWDLDCPQPWEALEVLGEKEEIKGLDKMSFDDISFALSARGYAIQPVYLYEHSEIVMAVRPFNDRWDSGLVGFIYMTPEEIDENHLSHEEALKELEKTVNALSLYYNGEVYDVEVYELTNAELYIPNQFVYPNWSPESICSVYEWISDINDIWDSLKSDLLIDRYFDDLKDATNLLIDRYFDDLKDATKEAKYKVFKVMVTKTITQEVEVLARSKEEAKTAALHNDFDLNQFGKVETQIEVKGEKQ